MVPLEAPNHTSQTRVHVEAVQTVTPSRSAGPRRPRQISASPEALSEAMKSRVCVVLAYSRPAEDTTGWNLANKLKESLNMSLSEHPVIAGRLRFTDADEGAGGGVEVRFTDSGVRLVQARADGCMEKFLGAEGNVVELAYWGDVEEDCFQYSPLFFVQLTIFEGQGYSIGLSGSLLVADPYLVSNFLKTWCKIHTNMHFSDYSIFHLGKFRRVSRTPLQPHPLSALTHRPRRTLFFSSDAFYPLQQPFIFFSNDPSGDLRVETREGGRSTGCLSKDVDWVELVGIERVGFEEGLKPSRVFCFLESCVGKGIVVETQAAAGGEGPPVAVAE